MSTFTVQDVLNRTGDWVSNYSTGQVTQAAKIRAVDYSVNHLKRLLGFPQDEVKSTFLYTSDNLYYPCPSDFQEVIGLFYDSQKANFPMFGRAWQYRPYQEILRMTGQYPGTANWFSHTTINGSHQIIMLGTNQMGGQLIESFDSNVYTASGDANSATNDTNFKYQGSASEKFTLTYSTGTATLTSPTVFWDFTSTVNNSGFFNLYVYFPSTNVTNVKFQFGSSPTNYYTQTVTQNANGQSWQLNTWNKLTFATSSAVPTGTPVLTNINFFKIIFTIPSNFGTVAGFHVDDLYTTIPDLMDLVYYSTNKGTNLAGSTISQFTAITDSMSYDYDFIEPLAMDAALYLQPSLRSDFNFMQLYKQNYMEFVRLYSRTHPKIRTQNDRTRTRLSR